MDTNYFNTRGSVRAYTGEHISDQQLNAILEAATHAPNTGNMQLYSVIVTRSAEGKQALAPAHFNQSTVTGCDVLLTVCADVRRFRKWCQAGGATFGLDNFQALCYAMIDATIFAQQIVTIAEMQGIGTCYMGTTTYNAPQIAEALALPEGVVPVCTLTMGYPAQPPKPCERLPLAAIVHQEGYRDDTVDEVAALYAEKENLPENQEYVRINGKDNLAQVFADIRYTKVDNEHFSRVFYNFLEHHGFPFPKP